MLETRQKPNGEELKVSKIGVREQRRALKQKMRKEFSLEANRNGQCDNGTDTASSSEDEDEDEDEKDFTSINVTAAKVKSTQTCKMKQKRKRTKKKYIPLHTKFAIRRRLKKHLNLLRVYSKSLFGLLRTLPRVQRTAYGLLGRQRPNFIVRWVRRKCTRAVTGIQKIPDGEWLCAGCEDGVSNLIENGRGMCALAPNAERCVSEDQAEIKIFN